MACRISWTLRCRNDVVAYFICSSQTYPVKRSDSISRVSRILRCVEKFFEVSNTLFVNEASFLIYFFCCCVGCIWGVRVRRELITELITQQELVFYDFEVFHIGYSLHVLRESLAFLCFLKIWWPLLFFLCRSWRWKVTTIRWVALW